MKARRSIIDELSLCEMLVDPVVQAVMSRDGVTEQDLAAAIGRARHQLAGGWRRCANPAASVPVSPPALADRIRPEWSPEEARPQWKP